MILSGHQPCYLPGLQFFNKIALSDAFMFVGHCDYQPKSWHSHNFIRTCELIVPVHKGPSINETRIMEGIWRRKHVKSIEMAYRRFRFFDEYFPRLKEIIEKSCSFLGDLNMVLTTTILGWLNIGTPLLDSRYYSIEGAKEDMLISMCKAVGADEYLSNEGSRLILEWESQEIKRAHPDLPACVRGYIGREQEQKMINAGIHHRWQKFQHPVYGQESTMNGGQLSVIDLLFRHGPEAGAIVKNCGSVS